MLELDRYPLERLASTVGTPFYLYDGEALSASVAGFADALKGTGAQGRYAMKANSSRKILDVMRDAGLWIDAVSGNEALRARRAGFAGGLDPPVILLTTDVFRDNAVETVLRERITPNLGSPGMLAELKRAGYEGPIAIRVNPGFGQGHVDACDTGGPSSKHGIWPDRLEDLRDEAARAGFPIRLLHAHVGTGPEVREFDTNAGRLIEFFARLLPAFPDVDAVSLGGGIPHPYHPRVGAYSEASLRAIVTRAKEELEVRIEIEPGRFLVAGSAILVARVKDVKQTRANERGPGHTFVMVDAGFSDLLRPAFYGAYHWIDIVGPHGTREPSPCVVAGPLCESGDVFTRGEEELLEPRSMPRPEPGDLIAIQDVGAYGTAMSMNYLSIGRAPELWWEKGAARLVSRRQTLEDVLAVECDEPIPV
ncbi:MAG TPA: diaminopimelate decarboxylase [Candidatus Angelobacter sp.]|nr:diaminopimelate decarboxylase [Candidatus Angelobacter sp.]